MYPSTKHPTQSVLLFSLFWAFYIIQSKIAFIHNAQIAPFQLQSGITALIVMSLAMRSGVFRGLRALLRENPPLFWQLALGNGLHYGVGGTLYTIGISMTSAVNAGFLTKFSMVTTILLAWIFLGERMSWRKVLAMGLLILGVYLLTTNGERLLPAPGDIYILGACLAWSAGNVILRHGMRGNPVNPDLISYLKPLVGLPIFTFFVILLPALIAPTHLPPFEIAAQQVGYTLLAGIFLALTWIFLSRSLKLGTASYMTMMSTLTPIIVSILAVLLLGEQMTASQIFGSGLILLAGVLIFFSDIAYQ